MATGMRVSVQPGKSALPVTLLCEQSPKVYVFSTHKIFTTFCAPFPNRISHCGTVSHCGEQST